MMVRKSKGIGEKHQRILDFIQDYQRKHKHPPSIREIGESCDISSTSVVNYYLDQLERSGHIERDRKISRGLRVTGQSPLGELFRVPILGRIAAGDPINIPDSDFGIFDAEHSVEIAGSLMPGRDKGKELFALEVRGDSMIDAMVNDGDIVVMRATRDAKNGDMVAIWLPDKSETTLKYFFRERDGSFRLQPANPTYEPIKLKKDTPVEIKGKVVMVIRKVTAGKPELVS